MDGRAYGARNLSDWLGIAASTACAAHCLVLPVLLVSGTTLPIAIFANEGFHTAMLWLILPAAVIAFSIGCRQHRDRWVLALGGFGFLGMVLSVALPHEILGETGERVLTLVAAAALVVAHCRNYQICRRADCCVPAVK